MCMAGIQRTKVTIPIYLPIYYPLTVNQRVVGSSPTGGAENQKVISVKLITFFYLHQNLHQEISSGLAFLEVQRGILFQGKIFL
jgi:hypothetical protein